MPQEQKVGQRLGGLTTHCYTKDKVKISVSYVCTTININDKRYQAFTTERGLRSNKWLKPFEQQLDQAVAYVLKYYPYDTIDKHSSHIERQIKNCFNENYLAEKEPLTEKGLAIGTIGLSKKIDILL